MIDCTSCTASVVFSVNFKNILDIYTRVIISVKNTNISLYIYILFVVSDNKNADNNYIIYKKTTIK